MSKNLEELTVGYAVFREKYKKNAPNLMPALAVAQSPKTMVISCCDSRVDPAMILQCDPGDLFVARNVANIVPPYEADAKHHGTSAAMEFAICYLNIEHLVIWGHSQCGGIYDFMDPSQLKQDDFLSKWVEVLNDDIRCDHVDDTAKKSLINSKKNCLTFPWIKERVDQGKLSIDLFFFDIESVNLEVYDAQADEFRLL